MEEIEVKILHAALFKLLFKNLRRVIACADDLMAWILGSEIIALAGILAQDSTHDTLRFAAVVGVGGIKIVHAMFHGIGRHLRHLRLVNGAVRVGRQAHSAKAQQAQLLSLKLLGDHRQYLIISQNKVFYGNYIRRKTASARGNLNKMRW